MKSDRGIILVGSALAVAIGLMFLITDLPLGFLGGGAKKPVPGKVYELTSENLAAARRHAPVLVALFTGRGNIAGSRMTRGLNSLAERIKNRAIVATGNLDEEPELGRKAGVHELPAWVVYRDGIEVNRATGDNADLSVNRFIEEITGQPP
jgi:thioredoxin-like negative regulator of GroEL